MRSACNNFNSNACYDSAHSRPYARANSWTNARTNPCAGRYRSKFPKRFKKISGIILNEDIQIQAAILAHWISIHPPLQPRVTEAVAVIDKPGCFVGFLAREANRLASAKGPTAYSELPNAS